MYLWLVLPLSLPVWFVPRRYAWMVGIAAAVALGLLGSGISDTPCSGDGCIAYSLFEMMLVWPPVILNVMVGLVRSFMLQAKPEVEAGTDEERSQ